MQDQDTLRILSVAVLFNLVDLTQACIQRYTQHQLSLDSIMRDLETICQLPRGHKAYLQLRDAALLLLFRYGPQHPRRLSELPSDYMADVLSADLLFVRSEYERYCLLKSVLTAFMQSIGKITWTPKGPVDQDSKRLSGFVKPLTAASVREVKRRRIGSDELEGKVKKIKTNRLSFTALVPFEKLTADVASGGVIDKATVLSYLLKTTIHYSNMTFEQLTAVRQDGIVDEAIVFRALWQREALERVLFPYTTAELTAALDDYFDLHPSDTQRKKLLLGTPRFRFCTSIIILPPSEQNGWVTDDVFEDEGGEEETKMWRSDDEDIKVLKKTFYSATETILGVSYRVQIEAQTASQKNCIACRFELQRDVKKSKSNESQEEKTLIEVQSDHWKSKIHYWIHCLNRHEGITDTCEVDPEDRVLLAATEQREGEPNVGYIGQVLLEFDKKEGVTVDMTVALELFGFPQV